MVRRPYVKQRMFVSKAPKDHIHIALCLMYTGSAFRGLQMQTHSPTHHTVEGLLIQAMKDIGIVGAVAHGRPDGEHYHFARSCRTDRGVHAVRNLVSLFVPTTAFEAAGGSEGVRDRINAVLIPAVRVARISPVTGNFVPRSCCNRRVYRYLIPAYALLAPCDSWAAMLKLYPECKSSIEEAIAAGSKAFIDLKVDAIHEGDAAIASVASSSSSAWLGGLAERVTACNAVLKEHFVGTRRFHNFSVDVNTNGTQNARVVKPESDESARVIYRCEIAPRVHLYPSDREGVSRAEYVENGRVAPQAAVGAAAGTAATAAHDSNTNDSLTQLPFLVFQIEGGSFLFNMIRKVVGTMLAVCRGARVGLIEEALSPEKRVATPLAPGCYLFLALSTYHGYDRTIRQLVTKRFSTLQDEWGGPDVVHAVEEFAATAIAQDVVDADLNRLPSLDAMLAARDCARRLTRPEWEQEDSHLQNMKEYKPLDAAMAGIPTPPASCSEMTLFLRLLRVHNWAIKVISLKPNSKVLLEERNRLEKLAQEKQEEEEIDGSPATVAAGGSIAEDSFEVNGGEDGWLYVADSAQEEARMRKQFFERRWKRSSRAWEFGSTAAAAATTTTGEGEADSEKQMMKKRARTDGGEGNANPGDEDDALNMIVDDEGYGSE